MTRALVALAAVAVLGAIARPAAAEYYRWTDDRGVSHYSEGLDTVPERYRASAVPLGLRRAAPEPPPAPGAAPAAPSRATEIAFSPGQRIMLDVRINGSGAARLQLDTGADRTLISPRALQAAGVSLTRGTVGAQVIGVTGTDRANVVMVESLAVGGAAVGRMPVIAYDVGGAETDGLLGRDFLDRFTVTIDATRGIVTLTPK